MVIMIYEGSQMFILLQSSESGNEITFKLLTEHSHKIRNTA